MEPLRAIVTERGLVLHPEATSPGQAAWQSEPLLLRLTPLGSGFGQRWQHQMDTQHRQEPGRPHKHWPGCGRERAGSWVSELLLQQVLPPGRPGTPQPPHLAPTWPPFSLPHAQVPA